MPRIIRKIFLSTMLPLQALRAGMESTTYKVHPGSAYLMKQH